MSLLILSFLAGVLTSLFPVRAFCSIIIGGSVAEPHKRWKPLIILSLVVSIWVVASNELIVKTRFDVVDLFFNRNAVAHLFLRVQ